MIAKLVIVRKVPDSSVPDSKAPHASAGLAATPEARLAEGARRMGIKLTSECLGRLIAYLQLLSKWNKVYNLTAITDLESMVIYHLLDSLSIAQFLKGASLLDVGTGAGLPGIPLALLKPGLAVTLLDSNGKKVRFVTQVCIDLSLTNVKVVQSRIESYRHQGAGFDNIVCRAFGDRKSFCQLTDNLVATGGQRLAMKGRIENRQKDSEAGWISQTIDLPFTDDTRHVQIFR